MSKWRIRGTHVPSGSAGEFSVEAPTEDEALIRAMDWGWDVDEWSADEPRQATPPRASRRLLLRAGLFCLFLVLGYFTFGVAMAMLSRLLGWSATESTENFLYGGSATAAALIAGWATIGRRWRQKSSRVASSAGGLGLLLFGFGGLYLSFEIALSVSKVLAFFGLLAFPALLAVAPWYELFRGGGWGPVMFVYGGGTLSSSLIALATWLGEGVSRVEQVEAPN